MEKIGIEKRFGIAVQNCRKRLRISQEELAERAGLRRTYLSDIERGARNISLKSVEKIAEALGVSIWNLFAELNDKPGAQPLTLDEMVDILLVEDDPRDEELTMQALKEGNITNRIYVVRDGAAALDFIFANGSFAHRRPTDQPQIILLDLNLPNIDGLEVLRRIKADPRTQSIPVVMLTGSNDTRDIATARQLGAATYIMKPVDLKGFSAATLQLSLQWTLMKPGTGQGKTPGQVQQ